MLFKGTKKRNAYHIINRLEIVGGEMNAFTTKEITTIYASVTAPHFKRALELLSDLTFNSTFPEKELSKEKKVIMTIHDDWITSGNDPVNLYYPYKTKTQYQTRRKRCFGHLYIIRKICPRKIFDEKRRRNGVCFGR
jgi:hypothetical protein